MVDSWRVTVTGGTAEDRDGFKEAHFKQLYQAGGNEIVFDLPTEGEAKALAAGAEKVGLQAIIEAFEDPLDQAEPVDFW